MRIKWALWALLALLLFVWVVVFKVSQPQQVQAQAIGYVASGQQSVTGSAAVVTGITYGNVCIKALTGNSINVYLGGPGVTTATGMEMSPGNAFCLPQVNSSPFYVIASTTGASVSWINSR